MLVDFLFPKVCSGCGILGNYLCLSCRNKLPYVDQDMCLYCEKKSLYGLTHPGCKRRNGIDGTMAIFHYNDLLKKMIKDIKYRYTTGILTELEQSIDPKRLTKLSFLRRPTVPLFLQPVPLHPERLRKRGFNQARLLAEFFGKLLPVPLTDVLKRVKNTSPQAQLKKGGRRYANVRGAFEVINTKQVTGKAFVLIDDVVTTGATVKEAARALKEAGAQKVYIFSLAHG